MSISAAIFGTNIQRASSSFVILFFLRGALVISEATPTSKVIGI